MKPALSVLDSLPLLLRIAAIALAAQTTLAQPAPSQDPLRVEGKPPTQACLTVGDQAQSTDLAKSPMLRDLANIAGELDAKSINQLRRSLAPIAPLNPEHTTIGVLRMTRGRTTADLTIARKPDGGLVVVDPDSQSQCFPIDPDVFSSLPINQAILKGLEQKDPSRSTGSGQLGLPYFESPIVLDAITRRVRFKHQYPALTRTLDEEQIRIRMPRTKTDENLPGILVWISPTPNGQIPQIFHAACDDLNLIAVGVDNNGNKRELTDRLQNHLDSIATIQAHYRTDHRRVYVTGMSGGGRCSSILQLAFPDVFMGAVPIVGLDSYHRTPTGAEGQYWPERLAKPAARWFRLLKDRRIAAITGTMDFNAPEMRTRSRQMKQDNINIRLDIIEGMGHTMPSSEQFLDALEWVDGLQQERIEEAAKEAQNALDTYLKRSSGGFAADPKSRRVLIQITIDAPWSDAAWEAARLLGFED